MDIDPADNTGDTLSSFKLSPFSIDFVLFSLAFLRLHKNNGKLPFSLFK